MDRKQILISSSLSLFLDKKSIFLETYSGFATKQISFKENLNKLYNFINFNPEEVEKDDPPMIARIKKRNDKLESLLSNPSPIFDKLLNTANKIELNS